MIVYTSAELREISAAHTLVEEKYTNPTITVIAKLHDQVNELERKLSFASVKLNRIRDALNRSE